MKDKRKVIFWSLLLIIILLLTIMFAVRTIHKYDTWKQHRDYLNSGNKTIEDWMTVNLIVNRSGIPKEIVYNELGLIAHLQMTGNTSVNSARKTTLTAPRSLLD